MNKILTLAACLTMSALLNAQTIIFVKPDGTSDGTSWTNACSLETAISVVERSRNAETEIWVQKGTYYPSKMLIVPDSVKIYGGFAGVETALSQRNFATNPTIIDGQLKIGSIFRLENSVTIDGFTIQNGNANGNPHKNGGGIWADEHCVIENCVITNNTAALNGGGVYAKGKVKIINSTIENNSTNGSGNDMFGNCMMVFTDQAMFAPNTIAGCDVGVPEFGEISFKSSKTWVISANGVNQEWSDAVMASGCNKANFYGGVSGRYYSDCRANSNRTTYGDLFSWCAVARFAHILCPVPWRVPNTEDFLNLDKILGGTGTGTVYKNTTIRNNYLNNWGASYGGFASTCNSNSAQGGAAIYWSQTEINQDLGFSLCFYSEGTIYPSQHSTSKIWGFVLRCIK